MSKVVLLNLRFKITQNLNFTSSPHTKNIKHVCIHESNIIPLPSHQIQLKDLTVFNQIMP